MRPAELTRYIALIVPKSLDADLSREWFACVRERAPYGVMASVEITDNTGTRAAAMVKRTVGDETSYIIPLSRDLLEDEANRIIAAFSADHDDDFDIEATVVRTGTNGSKAPKISVSQERYIELCKSMAKKQHEDWVTSRAEEGWRYGPEVSIVDKTHPLLRTWDQLPDRFKTVDFEQPQRMLDLLDQYGYAVVSREDLDELFRYLRR